MRKAGNKIIFDSEEQHEAFERALLAAEGSNIFITQLFESIGKAHYMSSGWWTKIRQAVDLGEDDSIAYDWVAREIVIKKDNPSERDSLARARLSLHEIKKYNYLRNDMDEYLLKIAEWGLGEADEKPEAKNFGIDG